MIGYPGGYYSWFWGLLSKALPTAYDDTLSYYEVLNKLRYAIGEFGKALDDAMGNVDSALAELNQGITDAQEYALRAETAASELTVTDWSDEYESVDPEKVVFGANKFAYKIVQQGVMVTGYLELLSGASNIGSNAKLVSGLPVPMVNDEEYPFIEMVGFKTDGTPFRLKIKKEDGVGYLMTNGANLPANTTLFVPLSYAAELETPADNLQGASGSDSDSDPVPATT